MIDLRQSPHYAQFMKSLGWHVEKIPQFVYIRKIPLLGSIIKIQRPHGKLDFQKIDKLAKKYKALFVKLEPSYKSTINNQLLTINNFCSSSPLLPPKTIWLDLTKSENQLLKEMKKDCRSSIKKTQKNHLTIQLSSHSAIQPFYQNFQKFRRGYLPSQKEFYSLINSFGKNSLLFLASKHYHTTEYDSETHSLSFPRSFLSFPRKRKSIKNNQILAGALFLISGKTASYFYAFTSPKGRKNFAQHLIIWEAIKKLKSRGIKILDLEGISDPRFKFTKPWHGFSHFKKSFGGRIITYPGAFTKYYFPPLKIFSKS